jgi:Zn-dependent peptidase ImmA (M78 family)
MPLGSLVTRDEDAGGAEGVVVPSSGASRGASRFVAVRTGCRDGSDRLDVSASVLAAENEMVDLEDRLGLRHSTLLPLVNVVSSGSDGARCAARGVRAACAAGAGPFSDLAEMLEFRNVRIHREKRLGDGVQSVLLYDTENHSFSVVLEKADTPERHVNRLAYELAWAVLFASSGFRPVRETSLRHRFAREFAAEFLMPSDAVRFSVAQLGVRPSDWTMEMVCFLKSKFNVSAEAFALRLEALGLVPARVRQGIRDELRAYYEANPNAMEPKPCLSPLKIGLRKKLLEMENVRRGMQLQ